MPKESTYAAVTALTMGDYLRSVVGPAGTPLTRNIKIEDLLTMLGTIGFNEQGNPASPADGMGKIWLADGTGIGNAGDLMYMARVGSDIRHTALALFASMDKVFSTTEFSDTFPNGDNWTDLNGTADYTSGYLKQTSDGAEAETLSSYDVSSCEISADIKQHGAASYADQLHFTPVYDASYGLTVFMHTGSSNKVEFQNGGTVLFSTQKYDFAADAGTWFYVKIVRDANTAKFKIWRTGDSEPDWDWEGNISASTPTTAKMRMKATYTDANGTGLDNVLIMT